MVDSPVVPIKLVRSPTATKSVFLIRGTRGIFVGLLMAVVGLSHSLQATRTRDPLNPSCLPYMQHVLGLCECLVLLRQSMSWSAMSRRQGSSPLMGRLLVYSTISSPPLQ